MRIALVSLLVPFLAAACGSTDPGSVAAPLAAAAPVDACWDELTLPRPATPPTPKASVAAAYEAWRAAFDAYETAAAAYGAEAAVHADAYRAAAGGVPGRACRLDADCATASPDFPGHCRVYYDVGQCEVRDLHPLPAGPAAPAQPALTCADFTCGDPNYECELERSTGGVACVLGRCKDGADPRRGGDRGGSGGGRRGR